MKHSTTNKTIIEITVPKVTALIEITLPCCNSENHHTVSGTVSIKVL